MGMERYRTITERHKQLIEGYFSDNLNQSELNEFTKLLKTNSEFATATEHYREAALFIDSIEEQKLLKDLEMDIRSLSMNDDIKKIFENYPNLHARISKILGTDEDGSQNK